MQTMKAIFLFICIGVCAGFPTNMEGYWQGIPEVTPLGPWNSLFNFTILPLQNSTSDWLLSDFYSEGGDIIPGTEQQWWIEDGVGMTYCGVIYTFFRVPGPVIRNFTESFQSDTQIQWCNHGCDKLAWTLTLLDENTLQSHFYYADPVNHLDVTLKRVNSPVPRDLSVPMKPPCNFTIDFQIPEKNDNEDTFVDDKKVIGGCPFKHLYAPKIESSKEGREVKKLPKRMQEEYQYCYILNEALEYAVAWNFLESESKLQVALSIPSSDPKSHYLGLGFEPKFPGMFNADVVMGYMGSSGNCVRSMYVPYYVGPPVNDDSMPLTDTDVIVSEDRLTVQFTRDFDSGHHNITVTDPHNHPGVYAFQIMWAVGTASSSCNASPEYHGNNRGLRYVDWYNPSSIFPDFMKCSYE